MSHNVTSPHLELRKSRTDEVLRLECSKDGIGISLLCQPNACLRDYVTASYCMQKSGLSILDSASPRPCDYIRRCFVVKSKI